MNDRSFENIKKAIVEIVENDEDMDSEFLIKLLECEMGKNDIDTKLTSLKELIELEVNRIA